MSGSNNWAKMIKENFNVTDNYQLGWVSEYAANHEIYEAALGVGGANIGGQVAPAQGVSPIYATPLNTLGMGDPMAPGYGADGMVPMGGSADFFRQAVGSGDIPVSTLPMALNVALMTIGLELLPVVPAKGPWAMLSYMDFPYAGGKLGRRNEIAGLDGIGEGAENKPLYFKVVNISAEIREALKGAEGAEVIFFLGGAEEGKDTDVTGKFKCFGRMDDSIILQIVSAHVEGENGSIINAFRCSDTVLIDKCDGSDPVQVAKPEGSYVDFAQSMVDFVDGFANFATGEKRPMSRAENETGTGNVLGLRLFSKWVKMGSYEVTATVTRQQLQDLPLYGVDVQGKLMEAAQNEISQHINARILEHVRALGTTNWKQLKATQGLDLNLWLGEAATSIGEMGYTNVLKDVYGVAVDPATPVANAEVNTSAENLHTRQRRIASRILAAANAIQVTGRRGRANWVVTNAQIVSALQDVSGYVVCPMVNDFAQNGSQNLYMGGTYAGLKIYVDPYQDWNDCRVCVGRRGNANEPGAVFMPYILADKVTITAEGTMAPKMLVNSRYAIADAGFYPEKQYYTFVVGSAFGLI